jgi:spore maturation protein CgeB
VQNETLKRIWADWKNVIIVTILVIINITSLTWAPIVASWFKSDPAEIEHLAKYIQDTMWLIVFIYAAQIIFTNRKKRIEAKKKAEQAQADAEALLTSGSEDDPEPGP